MLTRLRSCAFAVRAQMENAYEETMSGTPALSHRQQTKEQMALLRAQRRFDGEAWDCTATCCAMATPSTSRLVRMQRDFLLMEASRAHSLGRGGEAAATECRPHRALS